MDKAVLKNIRSKLADASKVALCTDQVESDDKLYAIIALAKHLKSLGKDCTVMVAKEFDERVSKVFEENEVNFSHEAKPLVYVISIDYGSTGIEKVSWDPDEKSGKLNFYITPSTGVFDFDNVEYSAQGNTYDLTITLGITSFKDMKQIYDKSDYLFKQNSVISIAQGIDSLGDLFLKIEEQQLFSEAVYEIVKESTEKEVLNSILKGIIMQTALLEGSADNHIWHLVGSVVNRGGDVNGVIKEVYYSKSYSNLDLQIKVMQNLKVDKKNRVVWSLVTKEDLQFCGVSEESLDTRGRITFNISDQFDLALVAYEVAKDKFMVVVESNSTDKYSAAKIAGVFDGTGSENQASFTVENLPAREFEKRFFTVLSELYSVKPEGERVTFNTATPNSDRTENAPKNKEAIKIEGPEKLTKSGKNDKNASQNSAPDEESDE